MCELGPTALVEHDGVEPVDDRDQAGELGAPQRGFQCLDEPLRIPRQLGRVDHAERAAGELSERGEQGAAAGARAPADRDPCRPRRACQCVDRRGEHAGRELERGELALGVTHDGRGTELGWLAA